MMMSKRPTMAAMMACRTAPIPLTMAIRQAPMVWKMDSIHEMTTPILNGFALLATWTGDVL